MFAEASVSVIGYDQKHAGKKKPGIYERKASGTVAVMGAAVMFVHHSTGKITVIKVCRTEGEAERFARRWLGVDVDETDIF